MRLTLADAVPEIAAVLAFLVLVGMGQWAFHDAWHGCCTPKNKTTRLKLKSVENALWQYSIDHGYPSHFEGLGVLVEPPGGEKPYLRRMPRDAWSRPIAYIGPDVARLRGEGPFIVLSAGADGRFGTEDDIYSGRKKRAESPK